MLDAPTTASLAALIGKLWKAHQGSVLAILLPLQVPLPFEKRRNLIRSNFASGSRKVQLVSKNQNLCGIRSVFSVFHTSALRKHVCQDTFYQRRRNQRVQPDVHQIASPPPPFLLVNIFQIAWRNICTWSVMNPDVPTGWFPSDSVLELLERRMTVLQVCPASYSMKLNETLHQRLKMCDVDPEKR